MNFLRIQDCLAEMFHLQARAKHQPLRMYKMNCKSLIYDDCYRPFHFMLALSLKYQQNFQEEKNFYNIKPQSS